MPYRLRGAIPCRFLRVRLYVLRGQLLAASLHYVSTTSPSKWNSFRVRNALSSLASQMHHGDDARLPAPRQGRRLRRPPPFECFFVEQTSGGRPIDRADLIQQPGAPRRMGDRFRPKSATLTGLRCTHATQHVARRRPKCPQAPAALRRRANVAIGHRLSDLFQISCVGVPRMFL